MTLWFLANRARVPDALIDIEEDNRQSQLGKLRPLAFQQGCKHVDQQTLTRFSKVSTGLAFGFSRASSWRKSYPRHGHPGRSIAFNSQRLHAR